MCEGSVLVVDDLPHDRELVESLLHSEGYKVYTAGSGEEALHTVAHTQPDLILLDIMMPRMDGLETCRRLKAKPETAQIPVIFISAEGEVRDTGRGFEAGGVDYLNKPFDVQEVLARLRPHLELARTLRALEKKTAALRASEEKYQRLLDGFGDNHPMFSPTPSGEFRHASNGIAEEVSGRMGVERSFRSLAENLPSPVFRYDRDCRRLYVNPAAERVSGIPAEQLLGGTPSDSSNLTLESAARMVEAIRAVFATGELHEGDVEYLLPGGRRSEYHGLLVPEFDAEGQVTTVLAIGHEVTGLREAERRAARFFANMPGFAFSFQMPEEGAPRFPFASPGIERLYGLRPEEVKEDMAPLHALSHPDDRPRIEAALVEAIQTLDPFQIEFRIRPPGGEERWIECHSLPERQTDGSVLWHGIMLDISERKAAQHRMELLDLAIDGSSDAVFLTDQKGHFHYVNATACSDLGYAREELLGMTPLDINPDVTPEALQDIMQTTLAGEHQVIEVRHQTRDGHIFPVEISASPVEFEGGLFSLVTARDITERKHMEAALAKSERDFRSLAENSPDNIARWDTAGRILYCNPTHLRTLSKTADELIGKTVGEEFPDGRSAVFDEALARTVSTGEAMTITRAAIDGEHGETRFHDIKLVPEFDVDGKVASVLGIGRDMTDIYRMQETLAAREAEYRALAENSPDSIIRYDLSGRRLYANAMAYSMTSLPHDKLVGGLPQRTERLSQDDVEKVRHCLEATAQTSQPSGCEVDFHMPDGSNRVYQNSYVPELGADGKVVSILGVSRDITAIREAEHRLRHLIDNLPGYVYTTCLAPDGTLSIPYISAASEDIYGLRPEEVEDNPGAIHALVHPDDLPRIEAAIDESSRKLTPFRIEYRIRRPGHAERWLEARSQPMRRADGTIVWHGMALDISERKRGEDALAAREQEFRSLAESSPDSIIRYDLEHRILYLNERLVRDLKLGSAEEVIGRRPIEVWPDGRFSAIDEAARRVLASGAEETIEMPYESCTGEAANGQIAIVPERNVDGAIIGTLAFGRNITDLKRANELLAQAQAIARLGSWDWDVVADRVEWSEMAFEIYTPDARPAAPGFEDFKRAVHPDDLERVGTAVTAAFEQDTPFNLDHRVVSRSRGERTVHAQGKVFRAADGTPVRMVGTVQDITERKEAQQRMELLEHAVDQSSEAVWLVAQDLSICYVNDTACRMLGYSREELLRLTSPDIDPDVTREAALGMMDKTLAGEPLVFESHHRTKDGRIFPVEISAALIEHRGEYFSLVGIRDITERKRAEQELIARERGYRTLLETVPDLIVRYDLELRRIYVNPAWEKASGLSAKEVINAPYSDIPNVSRPFQDEYVKKLRQVLATGVPQTAESTWITASGEKLLLEYAIMPEYDHRGRISGVLAVGRDITERVRLEEQLRQHQKMEAIGQLAGGVAHDFNNMLLVILCYTDLALTTINPTDPLYVQLQEIQKAAERSAGLTRQLLAFARKQTIVTKVLNLNDTLSGMLQMLQRLIGEDIEMTWNPGEDLWPVKVDPSQIDQVLANLCVNARDAINGIGKVTIETQNVSFDETYCTRHNGCVLGDYILLAVSDDGCGMDKETLLQIFEPFFTTKSMTTGTGLGLSTVYGIVKQHDGFIDVDSAPGQGTTFKIYIPRHNADVNGSMCDSATEVSLQGSETILIVDDEEAILNLCKTMLEKWGYTPLTARTPADAILLFEKYADDIKLILTDVVLPQMNGRELVERLTSVKPGLKCLYMSGYTSDIIAQRGVLEEGVQFIQKPMTMKDMATGVRKALD